MNSDVTENININSVSLIVEASVSLRKSRVKTDENGLVKTTEVKEFSELLNQSKPES
jgi:hypothetical protein